MSIETCKLCNIDSTPWVHINGHICQDCYESRKRNEWIMISTEHPPFNKPVLVSDGDSQQIRILMKDKKGIKLWETDHNGNLKYSVSHWMLLPEPPQ